MKFKMNSHKSQKMTKLKILNLYAGIGGNRKLWVDEHEVTAVEIDEEIAKVYQYFFPNDKVIITDAHQYLLEHFEEFDFIWSSPPCPSHSRIRIHSAVARGQNKPIFPDMKLYEEIIFLENYFKGEWVVENVVGYYEPLIKPTVELGRHYFWSNFPIMKKEFTNIDVSRSTQEELSKELDIQIPRIKPRLLLKAPEAEPDIEFLRKKASSEKASAFIGVKIVILSLKLIKS